MLDLFRSLEVLLAIRHMLLRAEEGDGADEDAPHRRVNRQTCLLRRRCETATEALCSSAAYAVVLLLVLVFYYVPTERCAAARVETTCEVVRRTCAPEADGGGVVWWSYLVAPEGVWRNDTRSGTSCADLPAPGAQRPCWYTPTTGADLSFDDYGTVMRGPRWAVGVVAAAGLYLLVIGVLMVASPWCNERWRGTGSFDDIVAAEKAARQRQHPAEGRELMGLV